MMWMFSAAMVGLLARDARMQSWHVAVWSAGFGLLTLVLIQPGPIGGNPLAIIAGTVMTNFITGMAAFWSVRAFLSKRRDVLRQT